MLHLLATYNDAKGWGVYALVGDKWVLWFRDTMSPINLHERVTRVLEPGCFSLDMGEW